MCQLTMIDIDPKTKISKAFIRSLTEINSVGIVKESPMENKDGFGYMTFAKAPTIIKSNLDAFSWWTENENIYSKSIRNANGIYHVRSASGNPREVYEKDAHPFVYKNIVLAHNGTLNESDELKDDKDLQKLFEVPKDTPSMIDSEKFTRILGNIVLDNKLTPEHIKSAMNYFTGSFAILIYDIKQPSGLFVVRGSSKKLHEATIYRQNEKIGIVINTGFFELLYWARMIKTVMRELNKDVLRIKIREIPKDSIYKYKIGSYQLDENLLEIEENYKVITHHYPPRNSSIWPGFEKSKTDVKSTEATYIKAVDKAIELRLTLPEICVLSEIVFGQSLYTLQISDALILIDLLDEFIKTIHSGRVDVWTKFLKENNISPMFAYKTLGIEFPYFLNSKKQLVRAIQKQKERKKK